MGLCKTLHEGLESVLGVASSWEKATGTVQ